VSHSAVNARRPDCRCRQSCHRAARPVGRATVPPEVGRPDPPRQSGARLRPGWCAL